MSYCRSVPATIVIGAALKPEVVLTNPHTAALKLV